MNTTLLNYATCAISTSRRLHSHAKSIRSQSRSNLVPASHLISGARPILMDARAPASGNENNITRSSDWQKVQSLIRRCAQAPAGAGNLAPKGIHLQRKIAAGGNKGPSHPSHATSRSRFWPSHTHSHARRAER
jgi:hypothetical protein